jgi:hypothetical protein
MHAQKQVVVKKIAAPDVHHLKTHPVSMNASRAVAARLIAKFAVVGHPVLNASTIAPPMVGLKMNVDCDATWSQSKAVKRCVWRPAPPATNVVYAAIEWTKLRVSKDVEMRVATKPCAKCAAVAMKVSATMSATC